jgi:hypothetical protein
VRVVMRPVMLAWWPLDPDRGCFIRKFRDKVLLPETLDVLHVLLPLYPITQGHLLPKRNPRLGPTLTQDTQRG